MSKILIDEAKLSSALEALEANVIGTSGRMPKTHEAITALREALAEQAQQKPFGYIKPGEGDYEKVFSWNRNERNGYTQAVYTSPQPQPAQPSKPIGKLCVIKDVSGDYGYTYDISTDDAGHDALRGMDGATLYTSPPANKPWAGLTDEQIVTLFNKTLNGKPLDVNSMTNFARALEAKLKEKNT